MSDLSSFFERFRHEKVYSFLRTFVDKDEKTPEGKYIRQERYTGACSRSFYVGTDLQPKDVSAKFTDGILELTFPKEAPKKEPDVTRVEIGE